MSPDLPDLTLCDWCEIPSADVRRLFPWATMRVASLSAHLAAYAVYTSDDVFDDDPPKTLIVRVDVEPHQLVAVTQVCGVPVHTVMLAAAILAHAEIDNDARLIKTTPLAWQR